MALTFTNVLTVPYHVDGHQRKVVYDVTLDDTSDPSAGYTVNASDLKLNSLSHGITNIKTVTGSINITGTSFTPASSGLSATMIPYDESPAAVSSALTSNIVRLVAWGN